MYGIAGERPLIRPPSRRARRTVRMIVGTTTFTDADDFAGVSARYPALAIEVPITAGRVGFILGPRLNAAGRIGSALRGVTLLMTNDEHEANKIARELEELNAQRQEIDRATLAEARDAEQSRAAGSSVVHPPILPPGLAAGAPPRDRAARVPRWFRPARWGAIRAPRWGGAGDDRVP